MPPARLTVAAPVLAVLTAPSRPLSVPDSTVVVEPLPATSAMLPVEVMEPVFLRAGVDDGQRAAVDDRRSGAVTAWPARSRTTSALEATLTCSPRQPAGRLFWPDSAASTASCSVS